MDASARSESKNFQGQLTIEDTVHKTIQFNGQIHIKRICIGVVAICCSCFEFDVIAAYFRVKMFSLVHNK